MFLTITAQALQPNRPLSEYTRERWDDQRGFPGGSVHAIAQTPDGYLWIGTEKGLVRFDGLNFLLFNQANSILPAAPVMDLMTDIEGNLWIRPQSPNLFLYQKGKFHSAIDSVDKAHSGITAMCRGTNGQGFFSVRIAGISSYKAGQFSEQIPSPNVLVISVAETSDGKFWMGTRDVGLFLWDQGKYSPVNKGLPDTKINSLLAIDKALWIGTDDGVVLWDGNEITKTQVPATLNHVQVLSLARDSDSNIWIGTNQGLRRLNSAGFSSFEDTGFASSEPVNAIFEDREGNLWVGSTTGIERVRDSSFITYSASKNPAAQGSGTVYIDPQGRRWIGPSEGGLYWEKDKQIVPVTNDGLGRDVVYSLAGQKNEVWVGRQRSGLTHLQYEDGALRSRTFSESDGLVKGGIYSLCVTRDGTVWAGSLSGGVSQLKDGKLTTFTTANGLPSNSVTAILEGTDGTIWFGTTNGLASLSAGQFKSMTGLPPGRINCLFEDSSRVLWIGTDNGVAILREGRIQILNQIPASLREPVLGIVSDTVGFLWFSTSNHILRVHRDKFFNSQIGETDLREFGLADGLRSVAGIRQARSTFIDAFGQIWFSTYRGFSVVDPRKVSDNSVPAIVHIENMTADGNSVSLESPISIPSSHQRIIFSCAGLSLAIPERVRFKFMLEGYDKGWSEPIANRDVVYTNLGPGPYTFRVLASNSAGLWNSQESSIQFYIEPAYWQRGSVRIAALILIGLLILFFYNLRLQRLTRQLNVRFEERLAERTRIAQDLHDTLLQGFLSASMQLHVAAEKLPADSAAKPLIDRVLQRMREVNEEGRRALRGLRSTTGSSYDLSQSFSKIQDELTPQRRVDYRVTVEGPSRELHPVIRDEIYHIGREALMNAFRHANASSIELELEYGPKQIRILVRDDGDGIDPQLLRSGREGHWGIPGMRERAEEIGATLRLWSRPGAGTEVELSIPGKIAYESQSTPRLWKWLPIFSPRATQQNGKR